MGITKALEDPSRRTAILDIVGSPRLVNALSLDGINHTIGKVLGPLVGGTLVETIGYAGAFGCILVTHVVNLGLMTRLRIPPSQGTLQKSSIWSSLVAAVRAARHSPLTLGMLYVTVVMNALAFPTRQFIPAIGSEYLGVGAGWVGLLVAAEGFGQLIGAGMLASTHNLLSHGRVFVAGSALVLLMAVLFVWAPWYGLAFVLLAIGGCGQAGFSTMQSTITMLGAPPEMRGRMMGLLSVCIGLSTPLGTLGIGMLATAVTVPAAITANALLGLLLLWPAVTLTPLMRRSLPSTPRQDDGFDAPEP
jgi:predicted MFS family arabinose efflux permease